MDTKNTQTTRPIEFHSVDEKPPMMLLSRVYAAGFDDAIVMVGYPPNSLGFKWMQTAYAQGRAAAALGLPPGLGYKMANLEKEPEPFEGVSTPKLKYAGSRGVVEGAPS